MSKGSVRAALAVAAIGLAAGFLTAGPGASAAEDKPLEQTQKNIQVIKGMPTSQLDPVMNAMRGALGVNCAYCHVVNGDKWEMEKDDKDEKKVARKMMQMVIDINRTSFEGKSVISCYTCHHGSAHPAGTVPLPQPVMGRQEPAESDQRAALPQAQEILDRYVKAVGGADASARVKTLAMKGTRESPEGKPSPIEVHTEAPDRMLVVATLPNGTLTQGYNGVTGWMRNPRGIHTMDDSELQQARQTLKLYEPFKIPLSAEGMKVVGTDRIGDREVYVVRGAAAKGTRTRLYFDKQSGLLLRSYTLTETILGALPDQTDFDDYRDVNGVKLPFTITSSNVDPWFSSTRKFTEIKPGPPLEKEKFDQPAAGK